MNKPRGNRNVHTVFVCAGEGGHLEQAKRFVASAQEKSEHTQFIIYTDNFNQKVNSGIIARRLLPISQYSKQINKLSRLWSFLLSGIELLRFIVVFLFSRPDGVVLFGPLACIPIGVASKLLRVPVVYIETWSRFTTPTITGRVMAKLGIQCYYQNESLSSFYKPFGGKYAGKL